MDSSSLDSPSEIADLAPFWQGSADELQWLVDSLTGDVPPAEEPAAAGPWINPLDDLADEAPSEESFLTIFVDDTLLTLDDLIELLLAHEGGGTRNEIEKLVAIFHRIKGSSAMVGLKRAAKLTHSMEDVLQHLLETGGVLSSELTDAVLKSSDALRDYVLNLRQGINLPDRLRDMAEELHEACSFNQESTAPANARVEYVPVAASVATAPAPIVNPIVQPAPQPAEPLAETTEGIASRSGPSSEPRRGETMRVEIGHLDRLMGLAGQLTIHNARFHSIMDQFRDDPTDRFRALFEAIDQLDRISDGIRRGVMDVRMVPIGPLLTRYQRVVRDLTRASGKLARLEIHGEKTELDKRMIDELADPLLQIVRNALDHGIEHPDIRMAAGKTPEGLLSIHAFHRGNGILIQVRDDGGGLDIERLREKGVEKGVISAAEAAAMTPQQLQALIWKAGMSTAQQVTEISGRGVGMDIVRTKIEYLHGTVEVESTPGEGTTFSIRLPLTLAILNCLMVEFAGEVFAIPMELVKEIVRLENRPPEQPQLPAIVRIRQQVLATMRLDEVLDWQGSSTGSTCGAGVPPASYAAETAAPQTEGNTASVADTLVIVGERGHDVGLTVDRVLGQEDIVIKSLAENYRDVPGVAGATILGDGRVALILDIPALLSMSLARSKALRQTAR